MSIDYIPPFGPHDVALPMIPNCGLDGLELFVSLGSHDVDRAIRELARSVRQLREENAELRAKVECNARPA